MKIISAPVFIMSGCHKKGRDGTTNSNSRVTCHATGKATANGGRGATGDAGTGAAAGCDRTYSTDSGRVLLPDPRGCSQRSAGRHPWPHRSVPSCPKHHALRIGIDEQPKALFGSLGLSDVHHGAMKIQSVARSPVRLGSVTWCYRKLFRPRANLDRRISEIDCGARRVRSKLCRRRGVI